MKENYLEPSIEIVEVELEQGFARSSGQVATPEDGETYDL